MNEKLGPETSPVLEVPIGVLSLKEAIEQVNAWILSGGRARLVTFANVHMIVEAYLRPEFREVLCRMDLNCPDGAPIYWLVKRRFGRSVAKIAGPSFMPQFCAQSVGLGHRHFLYGGAPGVAQEASANLLTQYPGLKIVGHYCPPFRELTATETQEIADVINASEADVVWVCLGCPKQEFWMNEVRDLLRVRAVLAVGQAFDILARRTNRAPHLLVRLGAEWAYRLFKEPRRLWKRYLVTNSLFLLLILRDKLQRAASFGPSGRSRPR